MKTRKQLIENLKILNYEEIMELCAEHDKDKGCFPIQNARFLVDA